MSEQACGPRISIVTVSLNQGKFLDDTLRSVREQTYPHIEHIVMDGGSTDNSLDLIRQHEKECPFPLQWRSEPDRGQSHAYNKAFALCSGEWLLYLNSSDYLAGPDAIGQALPFMEGKPGYQMYAFPYLITNEDEGDVRPYDLTMPVPEGGGEVGLHRVHDTDTRYLPHEATFFQRGLVEDIGGYSERFRWFVDLDFFCRALKRAPLWLFTEPRIVVYRAHQGMVSALEDAAPHRERAQRHWEHLWSRLRTGASPFGAVVRTRIRGYLHEISQMFHRAPSVQRIKRLRFWRA